MESANTLVVGFVALALFVVLGIHYLNRGASPLRKAWHVYGGMYVLHFVLFLGLAMTVPITFEPTERNAPVSVTTLSEAERAIQMQNEENLELKGQVHSISKTVYYAFFILALFGPLIFYNLFKYNLDIEKLSGKRMGSFD